MNNKQTCPRGSMPYIVKSGDTPYNIARTFGISVDDLLAANPGINPNNLQIGQIICVPTTEAQPPMSDCPTLSLGSRGNSVSELQKLLLRNGFNPGSIDGIFGNNTRSAVVAFQRSKNLTPDGIVGIKTWTALGVDCNQQPSTCPIGTIAYTIKSGDTPYLLAQRFNTTVEAIMRANPTINPNRLQIGQVICIP